MVADFFQTRFSPLTATLKMLACVAFIKKTLVLLIGFWVLAIPMAVADQRRTIHTQLMQVCSSFVQQVIVRHLVHIHCGGWSSGKTQDSGSKGPVFESRPDCRIFLNRKIRRTFAPLHPGV